MGKVPLAYPIGTPGIPWGAPDRQTWRDTRKIHRSYDADVVIPLKEFSAQSDCFELVKYGSLAITDDDVGHGVGRDLPLYAVIPQELSHNKPYVLITGGTHGYETSGVMGALSFLASRASQYLPYVNVVVVPCVCPWGYERIERWVASALDPNRSFRRTKEDEADWRTEEATMLMDFLDRLGSKDNHGAIEWLCHVDLHETTQSDCTEFRPAKAARDGLKDYDDHVPDGFYLVGDVVGNHLEWYNAILKRVEKITHIAEMEEDNTLSGYPAASRGLILVPTKELGLCAGGAVDAKYLMTTEVYPDSERTCPKDCVLAQVEAVCAALDLTLDYRINSSS
ncbi:hypothetical protein HJC23_010831 [Cyclotella cryptica]|uniref:Peptidase M14 domain-containing protein n=1 Tax=Cyclotella cryptica TaxID=29204 RepID=A0ABD3QNX3_9STRA|eukprot:CCRYP_003577-RA/>CCRYP_003577-RA protein AED:0.12 eAED:0.12 QI:0/-1/0/1/-1/1/1/0/337